jgi:chemotaxis receptor (MCP) glutamine deamidase CheD
MCFTNDAAPLQGRQGASTLYVHPGFVHVARGETQLTTLVGSCVAVACWDFHVGWGGMNHFLLPAGPSGPRYARGAVDELVSRLEAAGAERHRLRAKLFGGAHVLEAFRQSQHAIGERNIQAARELLAELGVPVTGESVGGDRGRKVTFRAAEGDALVRLI